MTIPDEAIEAAVEAHDGGTMRAALEAAAPYLMARAWDACAVTVEAATKLVAPDDITPMGARIINKVARNNAWMLWREARYGDAIDPSYRKWAVGRTVEWTLEAHIKDDTAIDELGLHLMHDFHDQFDSTERLRFAAWWNRVMDHGFDADNPMKHLHPAKRETAPA